MKPQTEIKGRVWLVASDPDTMNRCGEMLSRIQMVLATLQQYSGQVADLDEDDPNLTSKIAPIVENLTVSFIMQYPTPQHLQADLDSLRGLIIRKEPLNITGGN